MKFFNFVKSRTGDELRDWHGNGEELLLKRFRNNEITMKLHAREWFINANCFLDDVRSGQRSV